MRNSLFWSIDDPHSSLGPSIIFGTVHLPLQHSVILSAVDRFVGEYDRIFTETTLSQVIEPTLAHAALLPADHKRDHYISDHQWDRMCAIFLHAYDVDLNQMAMIRPLMVIGQLYERILNMPAGIKLDEYIWKEAQNQGKQCNGIESIEEQTYTMSLIPLSYDYKLLKRWGRNVSRVSRELRRMIDLYEDQNIQQLYKISSSSLGPLRQLLIRDRNYTMADRIYTELSQSPGFFTFGAGHLGGYHGVLRLLKSKGLIVKPIKI